MEFGEGITDWITAGTPVLVGEALVLLFSSFATCFITATFGMGGGVLMLAILLFILPAEVVIPVHALIQLMSNIGRTAVFRNDIDRGIVALFAPGCMVGAIAAAFIVVNIPVWSLELIIALFIVWTLIGDSKSGSANQVNNYFFIGLSTSLVSSFVGATGPLVISLLNKKQMGRLRLIGTHAACMTVQHLLKLVAFSVTGFLVTEWMLLIAVLSLIGFAGTIVGRQVLFSLPEQLFCKVFRLTLMLLCCKVFWGVSIAAAATLKTTVLPELQSRFILLQALEQMLGMQPMQWWIWSLQR